MQALATHAQERLQEALSVEAATADLRFVGGPVGNSVGAAGGASPNGAARVSKRLGLRSLTVAARILTFPIREEGTF